MSTVKYYFTVDKIYPQSDELTPSDGNRKNNAAKAVSNSLK